MSSTSELKNSIPSSNSSSVSNSGSANLRDVPKMGDNNKMTDKFADKISDKLNDKNLGEAMPRAREALDHVSEAATSLYGKATSWIGEGNNRNYGFIALAAVAGVAGFFIGRSLRSDSSES